MKKCILKRYLFYLLVACFSLSLCAEDGKVEGSVEGGKDERDELTSSSIDDDSKRSDVLLYGLESEVISLISELKNEKDESLSQDLHSLFLSTKSSSIRVSILEFFSALKIPILKEKVLEMLENIDEYKNAEANAILSYVAENNVREAMPVLRSIIENKKNNLMKMAISAIGKIGGEEEEALLISWYQEIDEEDEKKAQIIRESFIEALEKIATMQSFEFLVGIIESEGESVVLRSLATSCLANIKNDEVLQKLLLIYSSAEPLLKVACVKAITKFEGEEARKVIFEALKDNYYKVRLQAIEKIEKVDSEIAKLLLYRAKTDPEISVKLASIEKLGGAHDGLADEWMLKIFNDEKTSLSLRVKIAEVLLKNNFEFIIKDVEKLAVKSCKDDRDKTFRYEIGKVVAKTKDERTINIARCYIECKDVFTKSIGLDMFATNRYTSLLPLIEEISNDDKMGTLKKRAKTLL